MHDLKQSFSNSQVCMLLITDVPSSIGTRGRMGDAAKGGGDLKGISHQISAPKAPKIGEIGVFGHIFKFLCDLGLFRENFGKSLSHEALGPPPPPQFDL